MKKERGIHQERRGMDGKRHKAGKRKLEAGRGGKYVNAYQELVDVLEENRKEISQIEWVATDKGSIDIEHFLLQFEGTFYLNPSPFGSLDPSLVVVGREFWLTREPATFILPLDHWGFHEVGYGRTLVEPERSRTAFEVFVLFQK